MNPTAQYAAEAAIQDFLDSKGPLTWHRLETVLKNNGLSLTHESDDESFVSGMRYLVRMADEDEDAENPAHIGAWRRRGREAAEYSFTSVELGDLIARAVEEGIEA